MSSLLRRALSFGGIDPNIAADALIPCTIATVTPVIRFGVAEVLDCSPMGVDLTRAPLPLVIAHNTSSLAVGVVEQLTATGDRVTGLVRFATSDEAQQIRADVIAGIHRSLSVGYALLDEGTPIQGGMSYRWQPHEVSIVPVPADPAAGFFRSLNQPGVHTMPQNNQSAEEIRAIKDLCRRHRVDDLVDGLMTRAATFEQAREAVLEALAARDDAAGGRLNVRSINGGTDQQRDLILNTLVARMGGRPTGEILRSADCTQLAIRSLELSGQRVSHSDGRDRIIERALHTTSDFPNLLGTAAGRVLHDAYAEAPVALKLISREKLLTDFRARSVVRLGGAPSLDKVNESGEFNYGTMADQASAWRLATFGKIIGLSRQALVNDDLEGFADLITKFGLAAARREADELVAVLTSAPAVEGAALFSTGRSTQITNALGAEAVAKAVIALRAQKDGTALISQEPGYLVVPAAQEYYGRQIVAAIAATKTADVQPYELTLVVEPRLDAISVKEWYLAAKNQTALEHGYLDGAAGVQVTTREGFEVDGLEVKARLDFGCGWVAPYGWVKSLGTT